MWLNDQWWTQNEKFTYKSLYVWVYVPVLRFLGSVKHITINLYSKHVHVIIIELLKRAYTSGIIWIIYNHNASWFSSVSGVWFYYIAPNLSNIPIILVNVKKTVYTNRESTWQTHLYKPFPGKNMLGMYIKYIKKKKGKVSLKIGRTRKKYSNYRELCTYSFLYKIYNEKKNLKLRLIINMHLLYTLIKYLQ